jgi:hypothetical protein
MSPAPLHHRRPPLHQAIQTGSVRLSAALGVRQLREIVCRDERRALIAMGVKFNNLE